MHDINFVISSLRGGGAERVAVQLCSGWAEEGLSVVLTTLSGNDDDDYVLPIGVRRVSLNLESDSKHKLSGIIANLNRIKTLRSSLKKNAATNLIGFSGTSNILVIIASLAMKSNVIVSERNYPAVSMRGKLWMMLRKYLYRFVDHVVVQTQAGSDWIMHNTHSRNTVVIPNALTWPIPAGKPLVAPSELVAGEQKLLLAVGNVHAQKGFDLLLGALAKTNIVGSDWMLVIVGAGTSNKLTSLINQYGLGNHVRIAGRVGNIGDWYKRADAFVLSSRYEGFPNVLLEAMASGCAVVSFDCLTGPREMINHGANGLLAEPENISSLGSRLTELMDNSVLRKKLGCEAISVRTIFSKERMFTNWSSILKKNKGLI